MHRGGPITYWQDDKELLDLCLSNHLKITPLEEGHVEDLVSLLQRNSRQDGFMQMDSDTLNGNNIRDALKNKNSLFEFYGRCLVAVDPRNGMLLGFIIVKCDEDGNFSISELGVDAKYSNKHRQVGNPQNIGKVLLLAGCNEILSTVKKPISIGVMASTDESEVYYKKFHFKQIRPDASDELELHFSDYTRLASDVVGAMQKSKELKADKSGFFNYRKPRQQAGDDKVTLLKIGRRPSPSDGGK